MRRLPIVLPTALLLLSACGGGEPDFPDESEVRDDGAAGKGDHWDRNYDFYVARRDVRRCLAPACGGLWVERVNRSWTRCADGVYAASCYVGDFDRAALGLGDVE